MEVFGQGVFVVAVLESNEVTLKVCERKLASVALFQRPPRMLPETAPSREEGMFRDSMASALAISESARRMHCQQPHKFI